MKTAVCALLVGVLFGLGLAISGMTNPAKVIGFLDVAGAWDATLAFVMGGGLLVNAIAYRLTVRREAPLFAAAFQLPARRDIDAPLLAGSALFGVGWGLGGLCPGPALASLGIGAWQGAGLFEPGVVAFVVSMLAGMGIYSGTLGRT
jgi:uncharacterized membrane protein YedE/YeeE